jgi:hypothetical protein
MKTSRGITFVSCIANYRSHRIGTMSTSIAYRVTSARLSTRFALPRSLLDTGAFGDSFGRAPRKASGDTSTGFRG